MKILNFGSINIDKVYQVDHFVMPGETQSCQSFQVFPGGKGLNQSIALARAGAKVWHAGKAGRDGDWLVRLMKEAGVDTRFVAVSEQETGSAVIQVDPSGQNGILLHDGANGTMEEAFIHEVLAFFDKGDLLLLQNEINKIPEMIEAAWEKGMTIAFNPSPANEGIGKCDLSKVTWLLLNETEGEQLTGEKEPEEILSQLLFKYPRMNVVLTLGEEGGICYSEGRKFSFSAPKVKAIDTTGAGDTFTGYFLKGIAMGETAQAAAATAAKAAAIAVTREGASVSIPFYSEVQV